jgi:uncharacterized damage-inducible protein DinB
MRNALPTAAMLLFVASLGGPAIAQEPPKPAETPRPSPGPAAVLLGAWNFEGGKLLTMAQDFPEDKYDFKPNPAQFSFGEQLLHVAGANYAFVGAAEGKRMEGERFPRDKYKTKADIVAALKTSLDDVAAAIKAKGDAGVAVEIASPWGRHMTRLSDFGYNVLCHAAEHYGQLVVYYRVNDMVPPSSRPRKP